MENKEVIVAEDEEVSAGLLKKLLESEGYQVSLFRDGLEALNYYKENPTPVFITDLQMPVMTGDELIGKIKEQNEDQVIIVVTSHNDSATIINIMKKNVYDYIVKPVEHSDIISTVKRAFETAELRKMKKLLDKEKILKLESQLEWFKWNENIITRDYDRIDRSMFLNLHESFNQGAGFGSLLTLISLISSAAKKIDNQYVIDEDLFDLIRKNASIAEKILGIFSELLNVMQKDFDFETINAVDFYNLLNKTVEETASYASMNRNKIVVSDNKPSFKKINLAIDTDNFRKAFYEILINALKFSKTDTDVSVLLYTDRANLNISVINNPEEIKKGVKGIPFEYENLIFEPFFRIEKIVFEKFETPDYGLGLTLVEKIINKHNGKVSITNIIDSSDFTKAPEIKVNAMISIPVVT